MSMMDTHKGRECIGINFSTDNTHTDYIIYCIQ